MRNTTVGSEVTAYAVSNTKRTTLLTLLFGLLIAVLTACGQPNTAPIEPNAPEPQPDVTELAWHGAAIGYEDDGEALDLSSVDEGVVVIGSGADIWGTRDEFFYTYTNMSGDGALELRVAELSAADPWSKAGVMIRESLEPDAKNAMIHISGGNGSVYQARLEDGASTTNAAGADASATVGGWLRLTRAGDTFTGELSSDGQNWRTIGSYDIDM